MINHQRRLASLVLAAITAFGLTACGGESDDPAPTVKTSAAPSAEDEATAAYARYWDVYVQVSNSGDIDPAAFAGVADGKFLETDLKLLGDQAEAGVVRVGEPKITDYTTKVDGEKATSTVCLDESQWAAEVDGETIPGSKGGDPTPTPVVAELAKRDGAWIVTDVKYTEKDGCP